MPTVAAGSYVLNTLERPEAERERLHLQANLAIEEEMQFLRAAGVRAGARVLDLGCGGGEATYRMASLVGPKGLVVGVDRDPEIMARNNGDPCIRFEVTDAMTLPESLGSFDVIFARFLLQHVPDPVGALRQAAKHLSNTGTIAIVDSDDSLIVADPPDPELETLLENAEDAQSRAGGDRYVGKKLPRLMKEAGLTVRSFEMRTMNSTQVPFAFLFRLVMGYKCALLHKTRQLRSITSRLAKQAAAGKFLFTGGACLAIGHV